MVGIAENVSVRNQILVLAGNILQILFVHFIGKRTSCPVISSLSILCFQSNITVGERVRMQIGSGLRHVHIISINILFSWLGIVVLIYLGMMGGADVVVGIILYLCYRCKPGSAHFTFHAVIDTGICNLCTNTIFVEYFLPGTETDLLALFIGIAISKGQSFSFFRANIYAQTGLR